MIHPEMPRVDRLQPDGDAWPAAPLPAATNGPALDAVTAAAVGAATGAGAGTGTGAESMQIPAERMIGLRFLRAALRRSRGIWLGAAAIGLAIGACYHVVVPLHYWATSTVYLAHASTDAGTVAAQDDLAMLQTDAVTSRALAQLHEPGLTAAGLLGKQPGTLLSQNVLQISVAGPSPATALRRVNLLTSAYLSFRAHQYDQQMRSIVDAARAQLTKLQREVTTLTATIGLASTSSGRRTILEAQKTTALTEITSLEATIQQDNLNKLAVTNGSRVLGRGALVPSSRQKVIILDAATGLVAGLGLGLIVVLVLAMLSDRVRRREDVAALLGAPVGVSVRNAGTGGQWTPKRAAGTIAATRDPELQSLVAHLRQQLRRTAAFPSVLVVPAGSTRGSAAALLALSSDLAAEGAHVVLVDATAQRTLFGAWGRRASPLPELPETGQRPPVTIVCAQLPHDGAPAAQTVTAESIPPGSVVLVLATVDPAAGAAHLAAWASDAVVVVASGRVRMHQLVATAELLGAAGIAVRSAAVLGAEAQDESVGLPVQAPGPVWRSPSTAPVARPTAT